MHLDRQRQCGKAAVLVLLWSVVPACASSGSEPPTAPRRPDAAGAMPAARRASPAATGGPSGAEATSMSCAAPAASPGELAERGRMALERGERDAARGCFEAAIERDPAAPPALYGRGSIALSDGDRPGAIEWFRRAADADPQFLQAWLALREAELAEASALLVDLPGSDAARQVTAGPGSPGPPPSADERRARYRRAISLAPHLLPPYLTLADGSRAMGNPVEAIEILRAARAHLGDRPVLLQRLTAAYLEAGDTGAASATAAELVRLDPGDADAVALLDEARRRHARATLPEGFLHLDRKPVIDRQDLAALLVVQVTNLERLPLPDRQPIVSDIAGSWAEEHIRRVAALGAMDVFVNHEFAPDLEVTRGMLAEAVAHTLRLATPDEPSPLDVAITDLPAEHLSYDAVRLAVSAGIMRLDGQGRFNLLQPVSGAEAVAATERLARLIATRTAGR